MHRISFLVAPKFELLDLSGPLCAFTVARDLCSVPYEVEVLSLGGGPVTAWNGVTIDTVAATTKPGRDTLITIGGPVAHDVDAFPDMTETLLALRPSVRRMGSVCTGAFQLAEAGLLDHRRATTHWRFAPLLQARYPKVAVEMDRIFVADGDIWTSAGVTAGMDLALAMIEADFGSEVSKSVARAIVIHHRRQGGQSQFSALLEMETGSARVRDALAFAREHLHEPLSVERLAEAACISPRQFARIFLKETGETPARAIERLRAEAARHLIEDGREPLDLIARQVGFGDIERMRRTFVKLYGQSPQVLRRFARAYGQGVK